ncbi:MAG: MBL fold metallo-hydrolase [Thermoleophilia bacterium]
MMNQALYISQPSVTVYRESVAPDGVATSPGVLAKLRVHLPDRPGSLSHFAADIAEVRGNITFFHYDRSVDAGCVVAEALLPDQAALDELNAGLHELRGGVSTASGGPEEFFITAPESVLEVMVRLADTPGSLAAIAELLGAHEANVVYMLYDELLDAEAVDVALATASPQEIGTLLQALNERGYHYRVVYQGNAEQEAASIIGLKLVERFFLRLKGLMPASDVSEVRSLVQSSEELYKDLVEFAAEAGNDLEASDVYETVLTFASRSRGSTGDRFHVVEMPRLDLPGGVSVTGLRLPTSENIYLFDDGEELTLIDAAHGIYYADIKRLMRERGIDPSRVKRIFVTHPDTDHVGTAGYFESEFGTAVFMHPASVDVIANMNRAFGASGGLLRLNMYYTRLSSRFTECRFPAHPRYFSRSGSEVIGGFPVIDEFSIGPLRFEVLESRGGHTPGLVHFLNREFGLLFSSDYLLNVGSLRDQDKQHLGIYRYLVITPNQDPALYREEAQALKDMLLQLDAEASARGVIAYVLPGHGDYYKASDLAESEGKREARR